LLLAHTQSAYGLLGEVLPSPGASPRFQPLASSPSSEASQAQGLLGLRALMDAALETGEPVWASRLAERVGAVPAPGMSHLDSFLLLPLRSGDELVGLAGLAHPRGEADARLISELQPALLVGGNLVARWRTELQRRDQETAHRMRQADLEQLKPVLVSVEEGLWEWKVLTGELRVSRRSLELLGYAEGELEPTVAVWKSLCHPEDLPEVEQLIQAHLEGHTPLLEFAYRARRKDGQWAWILSRARVATRDSQESPVRVVGTDVDITARKHSEERLRVLFRALPDLLFRIRADGTFIDWNDGTAEPTALPPEAFLGKKIQSLPFPSSFIEQTLTNVQRAIHWGELTVYEYELEKQGRGVQRYEARIVRSGPDEAACIVRNITERGLMEERQAQLIRAERLASLGQLAAGIAHEVNNPLSYVTSNLRTLDQHVSGLLPLLRLQHELLQGRDGEHLTLSGEQLTRLRELWTQADMETLIGELPEVIEESLTGARRITEIVQGLRSLSRDDVGTPQSVDLNAELESTLRMVWNELKYKCEVIRELGPLPRVLCHPTQIAQVFTNLLVNAAQALETFGKIRIRTWHQEGEAVVEISDTGKGMMPETLSKLFTPFFTTKPRGQGTGLGLSISRDIITRHGGRIEVQSEPGKGSTFTVSLPTEATLASRPSS
ncbi:ATP-binding protein, partial [Hyalangium sp.]|uniref:ATP-binding protein n=1 Tax=Hyalangium sp. TaxID=2028555 RepID=UPI002D4F1339